MSVAIGTLSGSVAASTTATANTIFMRDASGGGALTALAAGAGSFTANNYTSSHSVGITETFLGADATSGAVAFSLPLASVSAGRVLVSKKLDAGSNGVSFAASGSDTIDGAATKATSTQYVAIRVYCDGLNWYTW